MRDKKLIITALSGMATGLALALTVQAEQATTAASNDAAANAKLMRMERDTVQSFEEHHYNSPAERASDALIITEVKASLADKGISDRYPVVVDSDHGTVQLNGVVASADDAKQATVLAQNVQGVIAVRNQLTWR
jgi:osmotically-inducible protein OsmY